MIEVTILDFILVNMICFLCGTGTGLLVCCKYKNRFMERVKSQDDLSKYNHHTNTMPPTIMASAPPPEPTIINIK